MTSPVGETTAQLQYMRFGGAFEINHVPKPAPGAGEVLIRQRVIAFNLVDVKQRDTGFAISKYPHVLGIEGAGVIEAVGSGVHDLQAGDEVTAWESSGANQEETWGGAFQERVVVPAYLVAKKPKNISLEEAASLP